MSERVSERVSVLSVLAINILNKHVVVLLYFPHSIRLLFVCIQIDMFRRVEATGDSNQSNGRET